MHPARPIATSSGFRQRRILSLPMVSLLAASLLAACSPLTLGRDFGDTPQKIKVGYHTAKDVAQMMGPPYRKTIDPTGREIFTYLWADGTGGGRKCVIAFNKQGEVVVVEVIP